MKISRVQPILMSYVFPEPVQLSYYGGDRTILKRDAMVIRVESDNGLVGYGPGLGSERAQAEIAGRIAPFLEGRTLADPDALRALFFATPANTPELAKTYCMVEVALYDLLGKALGAPVSELVAGRVRESIRLYGSAGMYQSPEGYAEEAAGIAGLGFKAYKMRPALGPDEDVRAVELMRKAVGPGVELMVDAHSWWRMGDRSYSWDTVAQVAQAMAAHEIAWLEEPLPPDDHEAYRRLKEAGFVPLASGEHEPSEESFRDLILNLCVDYVQMDVVCQGGFHMAQRLFRDIAHMGQRFAFHCWGTDLEVLAAAHLGICWPESVVEWLEYAVYTTPRAKSMYEFPLATSILTEPLNILDGDLVVPQGPGLGIAVDERVFGKYPWKPGPWSFFTLHSPKETYAVTSDHSVKWDPASAS